MGLLVIIPTTLAHWVLLPLFLGFHNPFTLFLPFSSFFARGPFFFFFAVGLFVKKRYQHSTPWACGLLLQFTCEYLCSFPLWAFLTMVPNLLTLLLWTNFSFQISQFISYSEAMPLLHLMHCLFLWPFRHFPSKCFYSSSTPLLFPFNVNVTSFLFFSFLFFFFLSHNFFFVPYSLCRFFPHTPTLITPSHCSVPSLCCRRKVKAFPNIKGRRLLLMNHSQRVRKVKRLPTLSRTIPRMRKRAFRHGFIEAFGWASVLKVIVSSCFLYNYLDLFNLCHLAHRWCCTTHTFFHSYSEIIVTLEDVAN